MRMTGSQLIVSAMLLLAGAALGCASASTADTVRGTAMYRERIALPPGAVLEVSLQDVSLADAPARELGSVRIEDPGNPPFEFEIAYDPEAIDERFTYAVRATIRGDGKLLFTTDTHYPVLTRGTGNEVELMLRRVPGMKDEEASSPLGDFPGIFEGEVPCADCPGIFYHLDLFEDGVFFLRTTYLGRGAGAIFDAVGSWTLAADERRLALFGDIEEPILFRVIDPETLRKLDVKGRDIESSLNYDLRRNDAVGTIEPRFTMRGMYRYMADAALFEECLSGRRFQVAQEADNIALERAYLEAQRQPGEALLVSIQGRIAERPAMEGDALVLTVVPEHFIGVWPGETCGARMTP
ncbi:MAG: YbaY family lipoprotein [Acidobacteria bacterium]|nr:YbaY family lipoprotein [Acidobacteriota bacterium]